MKTTKMQYVTNTTYKDVRKLRIKDILNNFDEYALDFFIEHENEDPSPIYRSRGWLENQNPLKKVWVMTYDTDLGRFER